MHPLQGQMLQKGLSNHSVMKGWWQECSCLRQTLSSMQPRQNLCLLDPLQIQQSQLDLQRRCCHRKLEQIALPQMPSSMLVLQNHYHQVYFLRKKVLKEALQMPPYWLQRKTRTQRHQNLAPMRRHQMQNQYLPRRYLWKLPPPHHRKRVL